MGTKKLRYRTVFLSDLHLGSSGCRAAELCSFLKHLDCETLYLVGDVIDMWRLRQRWYWPERHNRAITRILKLSKRGTRVVFIPGNHDEHARRFVGYTFGGVEVAREAEHTTADGRTLLITHGDQFDLIVKHARALSILGAWAYDTLVVINNRLNWVRRKLGMTYWSLSHFLKLKVKSACTYIAKFEDALAHEAAERGFCGVVCGHIHKAETTTARGIEYYNCGDWVESCTALVEHADGTMEIVDGLAVIADLRARRDARAEGPGSPDDAAGPGEERLVPVPAFNAFDLDEDDDDLDDDEDMAGDGRAGAHADRPNHQPAFV